MLGGGPFQKKKRVQEFEKLQSWNASSSHLDFTWMYL